MKECDHTIMHLHDENSIVHFVNQSRVIEKVISAAKYANQYHYIMDNGEQKKAFKPQHWLDRRRGLSTIFDNCPYCGDKIDWKGIKKDLLTHSND